MTSHQNGTGKEWDVAVIGGALSGAATALILKRKDPSLRIVIVENKTEFKRRVGEATVEVSGYFLCRVLGLTKFLTETQLCKNGLRFWFSNDSAKNLGDCSEIGGRYLSTVPSFLVDRTVLDEEVLSRAVAAGVDLLRPANVMSVALNEDGYQFLEILKDGETDTIRARWVIDASGVRCLLARQLGILRSHDDHPTVAGWSRWKCPKAWDDIAAVTQHPQLGTPFVGIRETATNHFTGYGWWAWWIALKGGDTSIGIVLDQRLATWPEYQAPLGEKIRRFLSSHPAAREMMENAEFVSGDVNFRRGLPYYSEVQSGNGFVLVGDALAFLDPFYSPGMDWLAFSSLAAVRLIMAWRHNEDLKPLLESHNQRFRTSYQRMYEALYRNKYDYLGDYDLMRLAFRLDIAFYYLFIARNIFQLGEKGYEDLPFASPRAYPIFALMRAYNSRFASIGRMRRLRGEFGKNNNGKRDLFPGFNFQILNLLKIITKSLAAWMALELSEGWRTWWKNERD